MKEDLLFAHLVNERSLGFREFGGGVGIGSTVIVFGALRFCDAERCNPYTSDLESLAAESEGEVAMAMTRGSMQRGARSKCDIGIWSITLVLAWLAGAGEMVATPPPPPRGVALVIGNASYGDSAPLHSPAHDAGAVAERLRELDFQVIEALDLDLAGFRSAMRNFRSGLSNFSVGQFHVALVYYSGRGARVGGDVYLSPVDVDLSAGRSEALSGMVKLEEVAWLMRATKNVVILDSSLDDAVSAGEGGREVRAWPSLLADFEILFAFSTGIGDSKNAGQHAASSPYTAALLEHLGTAVGKSLEGVLARVSADVRNATDGAQQPWFVSSLRAPLSLEMHPSALANLDLRQAMSFMGKRDYAKVRGALEDLLSFQAYEEDFQSPHTWDVLRRIEDFSLKILEAANRGSSVHTVAARALVNTVRAEIAAREAEARAAIQAMAFVPIPAGTFLMGSEGAFADERRVTKVKISKPYHLGKYEVTQDQWEAVMGRNPSHFVDCGGDCPVDSVSWSTVQVFLRKVNELGRETGFEYRLPTEAEWEYAARAGSTADTPSGDLRILGQRNAPVLGGIAWYDENSEGGPQPVGGKAANAWGLHDMLGNVWEWVEDRYGNYPGGSVTDPAGPSSGSRRVQRGGGWGSPAGSCRSSLRGNATPGYRYGDLGFRLLRTE